MRNSLFAAILCLACSTSWAAGAACAAPADFEGQAASSEVSHVQRWIVDSSDNRGTPYLIIDKANAKVFAFDARGSFLGAQPVLLGIGRGDSTVAGTGSLKLSAIRPQDRTTPAGRFVASLDHDLQGKQILLIDYEAAIALHPVVTSNPAEKRMQRLESATSSDNRISSGCINVEAEFFRKVVSSTFTTTGVVYILPETGKASDMFGSYDVDAGVRRRPATPR